MSDVNAIQHGGDHYRSAYQHWDFVADLRLNYFAACATKYVSRHWKKGGLEDINKAEHFITKLLKVVHNGKLIYTVSTESDTAIIERFIRANEASLNSHEKQFIWLVARAESDADLHNALNALGAIRDQYANGFYTQPARTRAYGATGVRVTGATTADGTFTSEGYMGAKDLWQCRKCGTHFEVESDVHPANGHTCPATVTDTAAAFATGGYVNQDR